MYEHKTEDQRRGRWFAAWKRGKRFYAIAGLAPNIIQSSMLEQTHYVARYGLAIVTVMVALLLMLAADPALHLTQASFLLFFGAVALSALYGGRGPGIAATILSALLANYFFLPPQFNWTLDLASSLRMGVFILEGVLISILIGALHAAQQQNRKNFEQLKASETEIKALNQALQHRVDELQTLFDVIPISIAIAEDPDCQNVRVNPTFSKLLQLPPEEAATGVFRPEQAPFKFYQNGEELTGDRWPQRYAAKHGAELHDLEIDLIRADHTVSNLYGYAAPLFDGAGQPRGSVSAFVDMSDRKQMETALRRLVEYSQITGLAFFETIVQALAELFQVRYAYVGEVLPGNPRRVRTRAAWVNGQLGENIEYDLTNTPCEQVIQRKTCFYPRNVAKLFPKDQILTDLGIESYMGTPLRTLDGKVVGLLNILHDQPLDDTLNLKALLEIFAGKTAAELHREQAIAELRQSDERYRAFVAHSTEGIWRFELEAPLAISMSEAEQIEHFYRYAYLAECNQVTAEMYGYSSVEEIIGARLDAFLPQSDPRNLDYLQTFIRSGYRLQNAESYEVDRFGQPKCLTNNLVGMIQHGYLIRVWGNQQDITEQKQIEEALRQSEARFRLASRAVMGIVYDWDVQTGIVFRSEGLYELIGVRAEDAPPTREWWGELVHPEDLAQITSTFPTTLANRDRYDHEYRVRHRDGHWVDVWDRGYLIRDQNGQVVRVVGSTANISDRKQAEHEREKLLARERAAREEAELANRVKDEFLAVLSHELRSPLNPILGWSNLLQKGKLDSVRTQTALATIERNAKLQAQLIDDLLDISRILRGKLTLNVLPVHLPLVIAGAIDTVRLAAEAKSIQLDLMLDSEVGPVLGDAARLQQVVWNLLSNAVKFTPPGGRITIRLEAVDEQNSGFRTATSTQAAFLTRSFAQITVSDTGKGIHTEFLPYVFEHFRQEDGATTRKFGGLGLGLAIARQIVEMHGGTIQADSLGEDQGATFTIRLPLGAIASNSTQMPSSEVAATDLQGRHILLVDDEADMRDLAEFILVQHGAKVYTAATAQEALSVLDQVIPEVLISDIGMPDMDGYMLMRAIRSRSAAQGGQIPAIALTAYAGEVNQQQALQAGFQRHIAKPIDPQDFVQAIAALLKRDSAQA